MGGMNLKQVIDNNSLSPYQVLIVGLCGLIALVDGFDTQVVAFIAPIAAKDLGVPLSVFGPIFAAGLFGGLLGALIFGVVADRFGRRVTLLITVALFAIGSLLTPLATTATELALFRLFTGFGLGGAMPSIIALTAEFSPARQRGILVTAMFCGFPLGAVVGAIGSAPLMEIYGWRVVFLIGGMVPLVLLPFVAFLLPESLGWLRRRGRRVAVERIVTRLGRRTLWDGQLTAEPSSDEPKSSLAAVFAEGRAVGTVFLGATFFVSMLLVYLLVSWVPTLASQAGHGMRASVIAAGVLNLAGIIGSLVIGAASDRLNAYRIVSSAYFIGGAVALGFWLTGAVGAQIFLFSILMGLFCIGAQVSIVSLASTFYPLAVRGSGVGVMMAAGRVGAIAGPLVGAAVIDAANAGPLVAAAVGVASLLAALFIVLVSHARAASGRLGH